MLRSLKPRHQKQKPRLPNFRLKIFAFMGAYSISRVRPHNYGLQGTLLAWQKMSSEYEPRVAIPSLGIAHVFA